MLSGNTGLSIGMQTPAEEAREDVKRAHIPSPDTDAAEREGTLGIGRRSMGLAWSTSDVGDAYFSSKTNLRPSTAAARWRVSS